MTYSAYERFSTSGYGMMLVLAGVVRIPGDSNRTNYGVGATFGEDGVVVEAIAAADKTKVAFFKSDTVNMVMTAMHEEASNERFEWLSSDASPWTSVLTRLHRMRLARESKPVVYPADTTIYSEGDPVDANDGHVFLVR